MLRAQAAHRPLAVLGTTFGGGLAFGPILAGFLIDRVVPKERAATRGRRDAVALVPGLSHATPVNSYTNAFQTLLYALIAITLLSALIVFALLAQPHRSANHA
ncbi:MAG TPA: hypothetical protein VKS80_14170 [Trinickia sp.]|nr:hypothetical protein [Trinickia sp.]